MSEIDFRVLVNELRRCAAATSDYGWDQDNVNKISGQSARMVLSALAVSIEAATKGEKSP